MNLRDLKLRGRALFAPRRVERELNQRGDELARWRDPGGDQVMTVANMTPAS